MIFWVVVLYGISTLVGYLMSNPVCCLVVFYGISTLVAYLMLNPVYIYIYMYVLNIDNLLVDCFTAYQPLLVIQSQILFIAYFLAMKTCVGPDILFGFIVDYDCIVVEPGSNDSVFIVSAHIHYRFFCSC